MGLVHVTIVENLWFGKEEKKDAILVYTKLFPRLLPFLYTYIYIHTQGT